MCVCVFFFLNLIFFKGALLVSVDFGPPKSASEILRTNEIMTFFIYLCGDWTK